MYYFPLGLGTGSLLTAIFYRRRRRSLGTRANEVQSGKDAVALVRSVHARGTDELITTLEAALRTTGVRDGAPEQVHAAICQEEDPHGEVAFCLTVLYSVMLLCRDR